MGKNRYEHLKVRVLKTIEHPEIAEKFFHEQQKVLKEFKVNGISSAKPSWMSNPLSYMIVAESVANQELAAGMRLDIADPTLPIPMESAISRVNSDIRPRINRLISNKGIAETCGWWVKKKYSGRGLPRVLSRASISASSLLRIYHIVGFFNQYSKDIVEPFGFTVVKTLGEAGSFEYPDPRYISTVMEIDSQKLDYMPSKEQTQILALRQNPVQTIYEVQKRLVTEVDYDLTAYAGHQCPERNWERKKDIRVRVLRAVDHPKVARVFHAKQREVYAEFGLQDDYSLRNGWYKDPLAYMIVAENAKDGRLGAGIRLEVADLNTALAIENAIDEHTESLREAINRFKNEGVAEVCGLWVGKTFSERGMPKILFRTLVSVASFLRVRHTIAFSNQHVYRVMKKIGFSPLREVGNKGRIHYLNHKMTVVELDTVELRSTDEDERDVIYDLREYPVQERIEYHKRYINNLQYDTISYARNLANN